MGDETAVIMRRPPGRDGLVAHGKGFHKGLADRTIALRKIMATDDEVMAWWTAEGKYAG